MFWRRQPNKRKLYFIDTKQQVRFAVILVFHAVLFPVIFAVLTMVPPFSTALVGEDTQELLSEFLWFSIRHWWVFLVSLSCLACFSVYFSHQIFGPMYRFEKALQEKKDNPAQQVQVRLRKTDYFQNFSRLFEEMLNRS
jgi:hypothetical protein